MKKKIQKISVIGDGGWGTTLSIHLVKKGYPVTLWGAFQENIKKINRFHTNDKFLQGIQIPKSILATDDLALAITQANLVILAVPSQYIRSVLKRIKKFDIKNKIFLSVTKGIETTTLLRMSEIIKKELGDVPLAVLSGPNIASEVARGIPSTSVIASKNTKVAKTLQHILNSDTLRVYTNTDIVGIELGGSLKNIIALACGVCDGLGFGTNTKSAIVTRGLVEMARLGKALGAKHKTFSGLAGLGDLATTCFSLKSRNRYVGEQLGKGKSIEEITSSMNMVAEGVPTVKAVLKLSQKYKVSMPISREVFNIIYKRKKPLKAVSDLMARKTKAE